MCRLLLCQGLRKIYPFLFVEVQDITRIGINFVGPLYPCVLGIRFLRVGPYISIYYVVISKCPDGEVASSIVFTARPMICHLIFSRALFQPSYSHPVMF